MCLGLDGLVDRRAVEALGDHTTRPGHRLVDNVLIFGASRVVGLLVFAIHDVELDGVGVQEVAIAALVTETVPLGEVVKGRVVAKLTDSGEADGAHADTLCAGEATLGVKTLGVDLLLDLLEEVRAAEDRVGLATVTLQLTDLRTEAIDDVGGAGSVGKLLRTVAPQRVGATIDAAGGAGSVQCDSARDSGARLDEVLDTGDEVSVSRTILPEHRVHASGPALGHVIKLGLEDVRQNGGVTARVLRGGLAGQRVGDRNAIDLELGEGHLDAGVKFLPGIRHTLGVTGYVVRNDVVAFVAMDARKGIMEGDREGDFALTAREALLALGHNADERLLLDGLSKRIRLDVEIKRRCYDVVKVRERIGHFGSCLLGLESHPHDVFERPRNRTGSCGRQRAGR